MCNDACHRLGIVMIVKVMAAMETNPFTTRIESLINVSTGQCAEPEVRDHLTHVREIGISALSERKTAVIIDAMYAVQHWSFHKDETFGDIAQRYKKNLLNDIPDGTTIVHFCCDRYDQLGLKSSEQQHRYNRSRPARQFEISDQFKAPDPQEFFSLSANKAGFLNYLCETWCQEEIKGPSIRASQLYLGGGFKEETKSVLVTDGRVTEVADLESSQQEADTRVILHSVYSFQHEAVNRVVIHANDTDVIVMAIYYAASLLKYLPELWVRTSLDNYLAIHEIAAALGPTTCISLPFVHSLSGRDTTSYPYFTGKKTWFNKAKETNISSLEDYAEGGAEASKQITDDLIAQSKQLMIAVYSNKCDNLVGSSLTNVRVHKFLNSKSTLLKLLPPTDSAFEQHLS